MVEVSSHHGSRTATLLFYECAEVSLITSRLARTIGSELKPCNLRVMGLDPPQLHANTSRRCS